MGSRQPTPEEVRDAVVARKKAMLGPLIESVDGDITELPRLLRERSVQEASRAEARARHSRDMGYDR